MLSFKSFITEDQLNEMLIVINNGAPYNQVVFLAGGAGSGKGFAIDQFMEGKKFKIRDVDEMKKTFLKLEEIMREVLSDRDPEKPTISGLNYHGAENKHAQVRGLDLRHPADVFKLHSIVAKKKIKDKTLNLLLGFREGKIDPDTHEPTNNIDFSKPKGDVSKREIVVHKGGNENEIHRDNILIDTTLKERDDITEVVPHLLKIGYQPTDIHIVWVLTEFKTAARNNKGRDRIVPDDILLATHVGAAATMHEILEGNLPHGLNGSIYVVLNNFEETNWLKKDGEALNGRKMFFDKDGNLIKGLKKDDVEPLFKTIDRTGDKTARPGENHPALSGKPWVTRDSKAELWQDKRNGEIYVMKNQVSAVHKFTYKQIKKTGHPPISDKEIRDTIWTWMVKNIPTPEEIAEIQAAQTAKIAAGDPDANMAQIVRGVDIKPDHLNHIRSHDLGGKPNPDQKRSPERNKLMPRRQWKAS